MITTEDEAEKTTSKGIATTVGKEIMVELRIPAVMKIVGMADLRKKEKKKN